MENTIIKNVTIQFEPSVFCNAWSTIKDFISRDTDKKHINAIFLSYSRNVVELCGTNEKSMCLLQVKPIDVKGHDNLKIYGISLFGTAYDEFDKFVDVINSTSKDSMCNAFIELCICSDHFRISLYKPDFFEADPIIQMNLKMVDDSEIIDYRSAIPSGEPYPVINIFSIDLSLFDKVKKSISVIARNTPVKIMKCENPTNGEHAFMIVPVCELKNDIKVLYIIMGIVDKTEGRFEIDAFKNKLIS